MSDADHWTHPARVLLPSSIKGGEDNPTVFSTSKIVPIEQRPERGGHRMLFPGPQGHQNAFAVFYMPHENGGPYDNHNPQPVVGFYPLHREGIEQSPMTYKLGKNGAALEDVLGLVYYLLQHNPHKYGSAGLVGMREICSSMERFRPIPLYPILCQLRNQRRAVMHHVEFDRDSLFLRLQWGNTNMGVYNGFTLSYLMSLCKHLVNESITYSTGSAIARQINSEETALLKHSQLLINGLLNGYYSKSGVPRPPPDSLAPPPNRHIDNMPYDSRVRVYEKDMLDYVTRHAPSSLLSFETDRKGRPILYSKLCHKTDLTLDIDVTADLVSSEHTIFYKNSIAVAKRDIVNTTVIQYKSSPAGAHVDLVASNPSRGIFASEITIVGTEKGGQVVRMVAPLRKDGLFAVNGSDIVFSASDSQGALEIDLGKYHGRFAAYTSFSGSVSAYSLEVQTVSSPPMKGIVTGTISDRMSTYSKARGERLQRVYELSGSVGYDKGGVSPSFVQIMAYNSAKTRLTINSSQVIPAGMDNYRTKGVAFKRRDGEVHVPLLKVYKELRAGQGKQTPA